MSPTFDVRASSYSRHAVVQRRLAAWLAEWLPPSPHSKCSRALEFGAGDGIFTDWLAPRFAHVTAIDVAPRMVEQGRRRLPQVEWRCADAWEYEGEGVDHLFSASLLHWCKDPITVLQRWRRHAKKDGRMLHGFYIMPTLAEWYVTSGIPSPVEWRDRLEWEAMFRLAGWKVLRSEVRAHLQPFPSGLDFLRFLRHAGAMTGGNQSVGSLRRAIAAYEYGFATRSGVAEVVSTWTFCRIEAVNHLPHESSADAATKMESKTLNPKDESNDLSTIS